MYDLLYGRSYSTVPLGRPLDACTGLHSAVSLPIRSDGIRQESAVGPTRRPPRHPGLPFSCKPAAESASRFYTMSLRRDCPLQRL